MVGWIAEPSVNVAARPAIAPYQAVSQKRSTIARDFV